MRKIDKQDLIDIFNIKNTRLIDKNLVTDISCILSAKFP